MSRAVQLTADNHHYQREQSWDSRCPCPALNALANHGYVHRDGRNITFWQLIHALREVYNLSLPLAFVLTTVGMIFCSRWFHFGTVNLHDFGEHNRIEHDCSMTHDDAKPGAKFAPWRCDQKLLSHLLRGSATTPSHSLNIGDFALARIRRALTVRKNIGVLHRLIAHGEVGLTMLTFGVKPAGAPSCKDSSLVVPREQIRTWFGDDRLPDDWRRPERVISVRRAVKLSCAVKSEICNIENSIFQCA